MRVWTLHAAPGGRAVPAVPGRAALVPEGVAWGGFLGGPLWLAGHRLWWAAFVSLIAYLGIGVFAPALFTPALAAGQILIGLLGHDLRRRRLERLGLPLAGVVVARDAEAALARALRLRPDLARGFAP